MIGVNGERSITERVAIRWPRVAQRAMRSVLRLPPGSRVRKAALERLARRAFLAWNRGDFRDIVPNIDDPRVETHVVQGERTPLGLDAIYYGPEGHCRAMEDWNEAWGEWDADIEEVIDEGADRFLVVARVYAEGAASGIRWNERCAVRYTFRDGRILRVDGGFDPDRDRLLETFSGLEAAGLSEQPGPA